MLIYDQNRSKIINLNNIVDIRIGHTGSAEDTTIYYLTDELIMPLGTYSSIKRCKEILEEILDFYQDVSVPNSAYYMPEK